MTVLPFPRAIRLMAWVVGKRWSAWHVEQDGDRDRTVCGLRRPAGAKTSRREAHPGHWPTICGGCKAALLLGQNRTTAR